MYRSTVECRCTPIIFGGGSIGFAELCLVHQPSTVFDIIWAESHVREKQVILPDQSLTDMMWANINQSGE